MASNFLYSTRDQKFILKEWLDMSKVFEAGRFKEVILSTTLIPSWKTL